MQTTQTFSDASVIEWLIGITGFLWICLTGILIYIAKGIHILITKNDKVLTQLKTEHCIFHKEETQIKND